MRARASLRADNWAVRRGQNYGRLIYDPKRKCPAATLQRCSKEPPTASLKNHPEIGATKSGLRPRIRESSDRRSLTVDSSSRRLVPATQCHPSTEKPMTYSHWQQPLCRSNAEWQRARRSQRQLHRSGQPIARQANGSLSRANRLRTILNSPSHRPTESTYQAPSTPSNKH